MAGLTARSSIALFAGATYGIPDRIYALYLAVAAALLAALGASASRALGRRAGPAVATLPRPAWLALAATVGLNCALIAVYNLRFVAPHGRLLFPSLVASGLLFARALLAIGAAGRRVLPRLVRPGA